MINISAKMTLNTLFIQFHNFQRFSSLTTIPFIEKYLFDRWLHKFILLSKTGISTNKRKVLLEVTNNEVWLYNPQVEQVKDPFYILFYYSSKNRKDGNMQ